VETSDLNAAARPGNTLDEATHISLIAGAAAKLRSRCLTLEQRLTQDVNTLTTARRAFFLLVETARSRIENGESESRIAAALRQAEAQRRTLALALQAAAAYAQPSALRPFTLQEALAQMRPLDEGLQEIENRLQSARTDLLAALNETTGLNVASLAEARRALVRLRTALQGAVDGEAMPVLPPFARVAATEPLLLPRIPSTSALSEWAAARRTVADTRVAAADIPAVQAHPVSADATRDDDGDDPRKENFAPRSLHHGLFLGTMAAVRTSTTFVGFVCDEWAEQRPSEIQPAAMAFNYDSPQSEPPHCLLLGVPSSDEVTSWLEEDAARLVLETVAWMKVRSLSTDDKLTPAALMPGGNRVAPKLERNGLNHRIPRKVFRFPSFAWHFNEGVFVQVEDASEGPVGFADAGGNEREGFFQIKE
jgi:hypothetical protein